MIAMRLKSEGHKRKEQFDTAEKAGDEREKGKDAA
jgi:hypothetical protein